MRTSQPFVNLCEGAQGRVSRYEFLLEAHYPPVPSPGQYFRRRGCVLLRVTRVFHEWMKTVAVHISIALHNHYFAGHEAAHVPRIPGSRHSVATRRPVGFYHVRRAGPTLLSA